MKTMYIARFSKTGNEVTSTRYHGEALATLGYQVEVEPTRLAVQVEAEASHLDLTGLSLPEIGQLLAEHVRAGMCFSYSLNALKRDGSPFLNVKGAKMGGHHVLQRLSGSEEIKAAFAAELGVTLPKKFCFSSLVMSDGTTRKVASTDF